ncbi:MAG: glycoside hydrolase family 3 C-terminal domain-containing protein [Leifsonia sp.]
MTDTLVEKSIANLIDLLTVEEKVRLLTGKDSWSLHPLPSIGLDSIVLSDGPVGVRGSVWDERFPSVNFPSPTSLASSWNVETVRAVGVGLGSEARRKGVHVVLAPTINLHRTPYGGRHFEAFSEDPLLTSELAREYVRGVQSRGVGATAKHYVANDSETERFTVDVSADERTLRELYLLAFEAPVVEARSWLVMSAYNSINGSTATESPLLTSPLNDEWGFDGVVVSDWTAVRSVESARHPQDLAMPGPDGAWGAALLDAVRRGDIPESAIDRKVERILRLAARVGALRDVATPERAEPLSPLETRSIARAAAIDGSVLLKNDGLLPLAAPASIAAIGEGARVARTQGGGSATVIPGTVSSPVEGLMRRWPDADVRWSLGAVVDRRLSDLPAGSFTTTDGKPGMVVRYLGSDGSLLGEEVRVASGIVSFDAESTRSATVEFEFVYRPETVREGSTPFGIAGLADVEVVADGEVAAHLRLRTAPGDDPATAILTPPFAAVALPTAAATVHVVVRFARVTGGLPDALALGVGVPPAEADPDVLIREAARVASESDVAIVVVSTSPEVESEGFDRTTLALPGHQDALVRAVAAANPRTVVVVNTGAPVTLPWRGEVSSVLAVWFPGQEFGDALAAVLAGDAEPGGRLPVTWPSTEQDVPVFRVSPENGRLDYSEGIHIGYRAWLRAGDSPAFPFGHGLGYTSWSVEALSTDTTVRAGTTVRAAATVRNTGSRPGKAVVQFYLERDGDSSVDRPVRWLVGFGTASADPGEQVTVDVDLDWRRFAHWYAGWKLEPGAFRLRVGFSSEDLRSTSLIVAE